MSNINYFEYTDPDDDAEMKNIADIADKMYKEISEFYLFLVSSIEPEDYDMMKLAIGYTETYDDHISSLTDGVPEPDVTKSQIESFLREYKEFVDDEYVTVLKNLNEKIHNNRNVCKMQAYQILKNQSEHFQNTQSNIEKGLTQGKVEAIVGGKLMSFETHNNPLLVSLFSLLLVWFSLKTYGEPPQPVVNV